MVQLGNMGATHLGSDLSNTDEASCKGDIES